jgi:hypothetical protein
MLAKISLVETSLDTLTIGKTGFKHAAWDFVSAALPADQSWEYGVDHVSGSDAFDDECWKTINDSIAQIIHTVGSDLDQDKPVSFGFYIRPVDDAHHGTYSLIWGTDPVDNSDEMRARLTLNGSQYSGGVGTPEHSSDFNDDFTTGENFATGDMGYAAPGWFSAKFSGGLISFTFRDIDLGTMGGEPVNYFGISMQALTSSGKTCIDAIKVEWHSTNLGDTRRNRLVALSNGTAYVEETGDRMVAIDPDSGLAFNADVQLCAVDYEQKLIIADSGRLKAGSTGRLAITDYTAFSDDDTTDFAVLGVNTNYTVTITNSSFTQNAKQKVTLTNADGGTFVLGYDGFVTVPIAFDASSAVVKAALEGITALNANVSVTGSGPWTVTFIGALAEATVSQLTSDASSLTDSGGGTPAVTVQILNQGAGGTFVAGNYKISSVVGPTITLLSGPNTTGSVPITNIEYSINRPAKIYDPKADTLTILEAEAGKGLIPVDHPLVTVYRDRVVWAGAPSAPTDILMSRMGNYQDYDYTATDSAGAYAIVATADAGRTPEPVVAMIPHSDECIIFGCLQSLWILRGDPGFGGAVDNISYNIGMVGARAWCRTPTGEICFLGQDGLYLMPAGCHGIPSSLSSERIPNELRCLDPSNATVTLIWSLMDRGVHILVTRESGTGKYFWFDWETKAFWEEAYQSDHEPFSAIQHYSPAGDCDRVYFGGRDGRIRAFDPEGDVDDGGTEIASHIVLGPFRVGSNDYIEGLIAELTGALAAGSGAVDWEIRAEDTHNKAVKSSNILASGTWNRVGLQYKALPRVRGFAATVRLSNSQTKRWALERTSLILKDVGRLRVREATVGQVTPVVPEPPPVVTIGLLNDAGTLLTNDAGVVLTNDDED